MPIYRVPVEIRVGGLPSSAWNIWHVRTTDAGIDPGPLVGAIHDFYVGCSNIFGANALIEFPKSVVDVQTQDEIAMASPPTSIQTTVPDITEWGLALTMNWTTGTAARRGRGRTFLGPLRQGMVTAAGRPDEALLGPVRTAAQSLVTASTAGGNGAVVVWGQQSAGVAEPKIARDITGFKLGSKFAHLRTRRD